VGLSGRGGSGESAGLVDNMATSFGGAFGGGGGNDGSFLEGDSVVNGGGAGSAFEKRDRPLLGVWRDSICILGSVERR
jgi:hypothetical protein